MITQTSDLPRLDRSDVRRALAVIWQDPSSRRFVPVARLDHLADGRYVFQYVGDIGSLEGFFPLDEYPELSRTYVSDALPVFFANRVMSADRPSYAKYLHWLGLDDADDAEVPLEVLVRSGGGRATDTFHIVDAPLRNDRDFQSRFFASGLRHVDSADQVLATVSPGDRLALRQDSENPANPKAVIIDLENGAQLGWVPDWLCGEVTELVDEGWSIDLTAERVNPDAPAHTRLLCRLAARR